MKKIAIYILLVLPVNLSAQISTRLEWTRHTSMPSSEVLYYSTENKLRWDNFKGRPPADNSKTAAITMSGFGYNASMKSSKGKGELEISVYCYFNKEKSWVKPGRNTAYILNHEQHHFDISYIAASIFVEKIREIKFSVSDYNILLPRIYDECLEIMNKMQDEYDGQTKNGQETVFQEKWNKIIENKLSIITN